MQVTRIMNTQIQTVCPAATAREAAQLMQSHNVGLLPVMENGQLAGVLTDRDIVVRLVAAGREAGETPVGDIMTRDVDTVSDYQDVEDVAEHMRRKRLRRVLVLDRDNYVVGVVSLTDLAAQSGGQPLSGEVLEEVSHSSARRPRA